mmetsp:Transcript_24926/g.83129  ORF Transcript_24926/g.83129 Transcript_24926/m.83129 type:complete len:295 (-) Transcript_24926:830-1714(-)
MACRRSLARKSWRSNATSTGMRMGKPIGRYTAYLNSHEKYISATTVSSCDADRASCKARRAAARASGKAPWEAKAADRFASSAASCTMAPISARTLTSGSESTSSAKFSRVSTVRRKKRRCTARDTSNSSQEAMPSRLGRAARSGKAPPWSPEPATGPSGGSVSQDLRLEIQAEAACCASQGDTTSARLTPLSPSASPRHGESAHPPCSGAGPPAPTSETTPQPWTAKERWGRRSSSTTRTGFVGLKATKRTKGGSQRESRVTVSEGHSPLCLKKSACNVAASTTEPEPPKDPH